MGPAEAVLKYLRDQNRPYSANDIFMNLHKEIGKTAVQKALDQLVDKGGIIEKVYGKQKVYVIKQDSSSTNNNLDQELKDLDSQVSEVTSKLASFEQELKSSENKLKDLQSEPTTKDAKIELKALEDRVESLKKKLDSLSKNTVKISASDRENIQKTYDGTIKEWRKRKRVCMDIVDSILEGYPKDKKTLLSEVGIETDEDVVCQ